MNKDFLFLKNFYTLLESGYSVIDALKICQHITHNTHIPIMLQQLESGHAIEDILSSLRLPRLFHEYFAFFKNKNCLSEAIEKSLDICISKQEYQNQLKSKLTYPLILIIFLFIFSIFVVFILLPNVNELFASFQIEKSLLIHIIFNLFYIIPCILIIIGASCIYASIRLFFALKHKSYKVIEFFLKIPFIKNVLQKYFSLKFAIYYNELLQEEIDSASIIALLNEQMNDSDLKIVLYEMSNRILEGEALEDILEDFEYLDPLFLSFFQMFMKNPTQGYSLHQYIELTYQQFDLWIASFLKYIIPAVYGFVAIFVITIYVSIIIPMMNVISDI